MLVKSGAIVATIDFARIAPDFERAELRFEGLKPPLHSFAARAFVDELHPDAATPTARNPHYLGEQYFYGLGVEDAGPGRDDGYGPRRSSQSARTQIRLNVTRSVRAYLAQTPPHRAPITFVAVDRDGREIAEPDLDLEGVSLVTM